MLRKLYSSTENSHFVKCGAFSALELFHFYILDLNIVAFFRCFDVFSSGLWNALVSAAAFWLTLNSLWDQ